MTLPNNVHYHGVYVAVEPVGPYEVEIDVHSQSSYSHKTARRELHDRLDEWLDNDNGTGLFCIGDLSLAGWEACLDGVIDAASRIDPDKASPLYEGDVRTVDRMTSALSRALERMERAGDFYSKARALRREIDEVRESLQDNGLNIV